MPDFIELTTPTEQEINKTWELDMINKRIGKIIREKDAIQQSAWMSLIIERYLYKIFTWDYGCDNWTLVGKDSVYAVGMLQHNIEDALLIDDRITAITDYDVNYATDAVGNTVKDSVVCTFTVVTIYGEINMNKEFKL